MTIPTRVLIQLAGMGLTGDQAEVVAVMLRDVEDATRLEVNAPLEARKASDRKRKAEERERIKLSQDSHVTSRDVRGLPVTSVDSMADEAETVFGKSEGSPLSPPKGGSSPHPKPKSRKPAKPVGALCPEDFRPAEAHYLKCEQRGAPRSVADNTASKLASWSHENAHREIAWKSDWPRALHRALDDEIEKWRRSGGDDGPRPPPGQRLSGPAELLKHRRSYSEATREPSLDLEPTPFPSRSPATGPGNGLDPYPRDQGGTARGPTGEVRAFPDRRSFG